MTSGATEIKITNRMVNHGLKFYLSSHNHKITTGLMKCRKIDYKHVITSPLTMFGVIVT